MPDTDENEPEIIASYMRAQALEDGTLVDVTATAQEMGIKIPVAMTRTVWERYVELTPAARQACNDERGRLWDILWMFRWMFRRAIRREPETSEIRFSLHVVTDSAEPALVKLKAVCGPGDSAEPVITLMLPEED